MDENDKLKKCNIRRKYLNIYGQVIYLSLMKQDNLMIVSLKKHSDIRLYSIVFTLGIILNAFSFKIDLIGTILFSIIVSVLVVCMYMKLGSITEEALIAINPLGYQLSTKYIMGQKSTFIPFERVQNIFINEVIYKGAKPRIDCLKFLYNELSKN
ncbi:uncharacterized protein LOC123306433 isoform X2 [Coccinella septempunctata]|uniref:uncharacterized protein LOC123306433 isoform X2 n=1 Tax=Coccinella septempunctata TaxID=41139 RepID=UPI001D069767|nr:uncharacterized protein LOC123306433 isoform X2 [Coccinella septempunctata]